jgi:pimeloyl-ACP methyl ester carboxylesterase
MIQCSRRLAIGVTVLSVFARSLSAAHAASDIGVVVLHGKQGQAGGRPTAEFQRQLQAAGYAIQAPTMCWAGSRIYDAAFPDCLKEIDAAVAALRAAGARRIVVAGHSLGGNAAIVYGTQHPELAGVIALAPAAQPEQLTRNPRIGASVTRAREMVAAGHGAERASFADGNNGQLFTVTTSPAILLSFLEPGGPADFPLALPRLRVPIIWVAGNNDRTQDGAAALFAQLPSNPLNRFVQVIATHLDTPTAGASAVLDWLKTLPAP